MRYFRTKDGEIYDTERYAYTWTTPQFKGLGISVNESVLIPKSSLAKEPTDNLEELCDAFVYVYDEGKRHIEKDLRPTIWEKNHNIEEIYGAIWVTGENSEPILKSVAKMDEKGELELLW